VRPILSQAGPVIYHSTLNVGVFARFGTREERISR
jgi:hypothetical protein